MHGSLQNRSRSHACALFGGVPLYMDPRVLNVITFMEGNFDRRLHTVSIARTVNISSSRLRHLFKIEIGLTPSQYLRALRLERAKLLLETTFLSVKQIAVGVGMDRDVSLVRDFKKSYGISPAKYRQQYHGRLMLSLSRFSTGRFANK